MKHLTTLAALLAIAACGSKQPAPTTPAPDHSAPRGGVAEPGSATTTMPAAQPEPPVEPPPEPKDPKAELLAAETAAWNTAKPVFDGACARCHTSAGKKATKKKLDHFNLDSYPLGGHHRGTIGYTIRDVLGLSGKKPMMPDDKPGSVQGDDLAKIKAWTDAWDAAEKGGAHPAAGDHDH